MGRYIFFGRSIPERSFLSIDTKFQTTIQSDLFQEEVTAEFSIQSSQVVADVRLADCDDMVGVETIRNLLHNAIRPVLDAIGYSVGTAFDLDIATVLLPDGTHRSLSATIPIISSTARGLPQHKILELALTSPHLQRALANLREAIKQPDDTGFFCFRAVESLKHYWDTLSKNRKRPALERALRLRPEIWDSLSEWANDRRHGGNERSMTDNQRAVVMQISWMIVERFAMLLDLPGEERLGATVSVAMCPDELVPPSLNPTDKL